MLVKDFNLLPTTGFSITPLKVKLLAGEQKATEISLYAPHILTHAQVLFCFGAQGRNTLTHLKGLQSGAS